MNGVAVLLRHVRGFPVPFVYADKPDERVDVFGDNLELYLHEPGFE